MPKTKYDLKKFTSTCDVIADISESSIEGKDAVLRVAAQILHESGQSFGVASAFVLISAENKELCNYSNKIIIKYNEANELEGNSNPIPESL